MIRRIVRTGLKPGFQAGVILFFKKLANAAQDFPQAAFKAFSKSLQNEWAFIQRVLSGHDNLFGALKEVIRINFLPTLFNLELSDTELDLMCMPSSLCGLGINDPLKSGGHQYLVSKKSTTVLAQAISSGTPLDLNQHLIQIREAGQYKSSFYASLKEESELLLNKFPIERKNMLKRKIDFKCSGWLTVCPREGNFLK